MSADYGPALWIPTDHHGGWPFQPRYIIVHGTAGGSSAQGIAQYFQGNDPPTSTHYVIGVDGTVAQCVAESEPAWGNGVLSAGHDPWWDAYGNPNSVTLSIEHCKPHTDNSDQLSPAQQEASFALIKHLCEQHSIPMRWADATGGITGHYSIDPVNRAFCPGVFPWDALFAYLNNGGNMAGVPNGWTDDGSTLKAPNGHVVRMGFRTFILNNSWNPADVPLEEEQHRNPVEWHNLALGAGQRQLFRLTALRWNNTEGVKTENLGEELQAVEAQLAQAHAAIASMAAAQQQQLADLQAQLAAAVALQGNPAEHQLLLNIKAEVAGVQ